MVGRWNEYYQISLYLDVMLVDVQNKVNVWIEQLQLALCRK